MSEATKFDSGKPPVGLVDPHFILEVARVLQFGSEKYAPHNWRKGMEWSRIYDAAQRHLLAWASGEETDDESGLNHLAHAACCLMFLLSYSKTGTGTDDRWRGAA